MQFIRSNDEVELVCRLSDCLPNGTDTETLDLACCSLCKWFDSYHPVQDAEEYDRQLELEDSQSAKNHGFIVGWHDLECCVVSPTKGSLFYAHVPVF